MVGAVPECLGCEYPYDHGVHEPMSLSCGHSICRECWKEWVQRKGAICPIGCKEVTAAVNYVLRDIVQPGGTPCDKHPNQNLEYICPDDEAACCARCIILDHHGHHRPLQLDFSTLRPMFEAALTETSRRLSVVETIESDAQRICNDAGEFVRNVVARRDELLRSVLPGYLGGLPWSFGQQPVQQLNTSEVRMHYDRLKHHLEAETDPAGAFKTYRELKESLSRCLPHIPPVPQASYDRSGIEDIFGTIHNWGNGASGSGRSLSAMNQQQRIPPTMSFSALSLGPSKHAGLPSTSVSFLNSPPLNGSTPSDTHSPSLFSMNAFAAPPQSPNPRSTISMPSPLQIGGVGGSSSGILNGWPSATHIALASSESSLSSPTDSPHRIISAMSDLTLSSAASPARPPSLLESNNNNAATSSSSNGHHQAASTAQYSTAVASASRITTPGPATATQVVQQSSPSPAVISPSPQPQPQQQQQQQEAPSALEDTDAGEEFRGIVACLLNDTHDEGFCEVQGPNRQAWNVYFNLHGGKVATVNLSGFDPGMLEAGYEVFVKLADNPDHVRASQDPARRYVARSMRLGSPPKPVRGIVISTWNDGQDGFAQVESPDGHTQYKVYFRFGLGGTFKTGHDPKTLNPSKLKPGMPVHVTLMLNPQKDKARQDVTRKFVARSVKLIGS